MAKSEAEKVAEKMLNLTKDSTLDLEQVGVYLANSYPSFLLNRLEYIVEVAKDEREGINVGDYDTLY